MPSLRTLELINPEIEMKFKLTKEFMYKNDFLEYVVNFRTVAEIIDLTIGIRNFLQRCNIDWDTIDQDLTSFEIMCHPADPKKGCMGVFVTPGGVAFRRLGYLEFDELGSFIKAAKSKNKWRYNYYD